MSVWLIQVKLTNIPDFQIPLYSGLGLDRYPYNNNYQTIFISQRIKIKI
jgi:hypothetical protein